MSVFGALNSGISALRSFAKGMEVVGNNIANVNTVAYKGNRITYSDTFSQVLQSSSPSPQDGRGSNVPSSQIGLGVQINGIQGLFHQGGLTTTNQKTDLAIVGEGFFMVTDSANNNRAYATRAGDFRIDDNGFLVTSSGLRVQGLFDGAIAFNASVDGDGQFRFDKNNDSTSGTIQPGREGSILMNFNKSAASSIEDVYDPVNSPVRNAVYYSNNLVQRTGDAYEFVADSGYHAFAEGAVNDLFALYNAARTMPNFDTGFSFSLQDAKDVVNTQFRAALGLVPAALPGGFAELNGVAATSAIQDAANLFFTTGAYPNPTTVTAIANKVPADVASAEERMTSILRSKTPDMVNYSISPEGEIKFFLSNGDSFTRGRIMMVDFYDVSALVREGQNLFSGFEAARIKTLNAQGQPGLAEAGRDGLGRLQQQALEMSNIDLTEEFSNMIITQRGFQAGSRIITVSDDILQEVVNLKR